MGVVPPIFARHLRVQLVDTGRPPQLVDPGLQPGKRALCFVLFPSHHPSRPRPSLLIRAIRKIRGSIRGYKKRPATPSSRVTDLDGSTSLFVCVDCSYRRKILRLYSLLIPQSSVLISQSSILLPIRTVLPPPTYTCPPRTSTVIMPNLVVVSASCSFRPTVANAWSIARSRAVRGEASVVGAGVGSTITVLAPKGNAHPFVLGIG